MTLAERIRRAARLKGVKDGELAAVAGISSSGLSKIMNQKVSPRFDTVEAIVEALGMSLQEFFGLGEDPAAERALMLLREEAGRGEWPAATRGHEVSDELLGRAIRIALEVVRREKQER